MKERKIFEQKYKDYLGNEEVQKCVETYNTFKENPSELNSYLQGRRTKFEYAYDVCNGWIEEIIFRERLNSAFQERGSDVMLRSNGKDKDRVFRRTSGRVSAAPDFLMLRGHMYRHLELKMSVSIRNPTTPKKKSYEKTKDHKGLMLYHYKDVDKYFLLDLARDHNFECKPNERMDGKECYIVPNEFVLENLMNLEELVSFIDAEVEFESL